MQDFLKTGPLSAYKIWALTPLNIFFNPGIAIHFFFLLSGFVQSYHYYTSNDPIVLQKSFIKRYFRLAIPTVCVLLMVYACHKLHWFHKELIPENILSAGWTKSLCPDNMGFFKVFMQGIYDCFMGNTRYYPILWTMPAELQNSFMVLILLMITHTAKHKTRLFVFWLCVQLFVFNGYYSAAFTIGMLIAKFDHDSASFRSFFSKSSVKILCFVLGIYFGSYPYTGYEHSSEHSIYKLISVFDTIPHILSFLIGSVFLLLFFLRSQKAQRFFSAKKLRWFGAQSFLFYLVHFLILLSFSPWLYYKVAAHNSRAVALWTSGLCSFALVTALSYVLTRWIDTPVLALCHKLQDLVFGRDQRLNNTKAAQ